MSDGRPANPERRRDRNRRWTVARSLPLEDVEPRGTRQQWRRSAVLLDGDRAVVGTPGGQVRAFDLGSTDESPAFDVAVGDRTVTLARAGEDLVAGTRGQDGWLRGLDPDTGAIRWSVRTADDVGEPARESMFAQPFVVSVATAEGVAYAAARRYERAPGGAGGDRRFESVVYAVGDGRVRWRYRTDASAIGLESDGDRVTVAFNRCPGDHDRGVVVLDAATGRERWSWDPDAGGERRVGDVALTDEGVAAASHADYRGYLLADGEERWRVDLGRPERRGEQTVYAYPTHAAALEDGLAFVTGNTFPEEGRETDRRHGNEHSLAVVDGGSVRRRVPVGGWVSELAGGPERLVVPRGQHFRDRDPSVHGVGVLGPAGSTPVLDARGPVVAVDADGERIAAVEEPVAFHDGDQVRGRHRLVVAESRAE